MIEHLARDESAAIVRGLRGWLAEQPERDWHADPPRRPNADRVVRVAPHVTDALDKIRLTVRGEP